MASTSRPNRPRRAPRHPTPFVALDPSLQRPLHRQLYDALRVAIVSGRLPGGARLPSTRQFALEIGVSRVTVAGAFDQLRAEGYVEARGGSGTFVCAVLPDDALHAGGGNSRVPRIRGTLPTSAAHATGFAVSRVASDTPPTVAVSAVQPALPSTPGTTGLGGTAAFRIGIPALDLFPVSLWSRLTARRWRDMVGPESERLLSYGYALGFPPLRRAIADYVTVARGVRCDESQVIVTAGAQQALDLIGRVLLEPGDAVLLEEPGYFGAREAFAAADARITAVPLDDEGMDVPVGEALSPHARLACVSPSHQFPLGVTMSVQRRLALLEWATRTGAWIVEDDYDGEFRYVGRPLASLQGLEAERSADASKGGCGRVLYVGTFSKTLYPSLRLGYVIVPTSLVGAFAEAKAATDRHTATIDQAVLTDFITEGHYARHVRRMRLSYAARQATVVAAAATHLAPWLEVQPSDAGMHLVGWLRDSLPPGITDQALSKAALENGVVAVALSSCRAQPSQDAPGIDRSRGALLLGYSGCSDAMIWEGAKRLGRAISSVVRAR